MKRGAIWSSWCCNRSVKRSEFIRRLVLNYISDDYENVDQCILHDVGKDGTRCGLTIERHEIVAALGQLIEDGLAKAYLLSSTEPARELEGMSPLDAIERNFKTYFYITKKEMDFHLADDAWWPFDDEENLRPDWRLENE